jgi:hypothetical protein
MLAVMLAAMRVELARARALEGFRVGDEEGPSLEEAVGAKSLLYPAKLELSKGVHEAGKNRLKKYFFCLSMLYI